MNIKFISSSAVKKIIIFYECVAQVKMLIFSPHMVFVEKSKFSFYFILNGNTESTSRFSFDLTFVLCLLGITLGVNIICT